LLSKFALVALAVLAAAPAAAAAPGATARYILPPGNYCGLAALGPDPAQWRTTAARTSFAPGLIPDTMRATNRPTFQQVLELAHP
jgi:hypothetical protein